MNLNSEGMSLGPNERTLKERLLSKTVIREDGCWEFIGGRNLYNGGQGVIWSGGSRRSGGRFIGAHVASYLVHVGDIPAGKHILHSCGLHDAAEDHPWCVNPAHLRTGTPLENTRDAMERGYFHPQGEGHHLTKLSDDQVRQIFQLLAENKLTLREIGERFGVDLKVISNINIGKNWQHLAPDGWDPKARKQFRVRGEQQIINSKLTEAKVREIMKLLQEGNLTNGQIGRMFGVSSGCVNGIRTRNNWSWLCPELVFPPNPPLDRPVKLTEAQVANIRGLMLRDQRFGLGIELARRYDVASTTIYQIANGVCWRHVKPSSNPVMPPPRREEKSFA